MWYTGFVLFAVAVGVHSVSDIILSEKVPLEGRPNAAGLPNADTRIVNGEEADIKDYPYQVSFIVNNSYFCGGFIVETWKKKRIADGQSRERQPHPVVMKQSLLEVTVAADQEAAQFLDHQTCVGRDAAGHAREVQGTPDPLRDGSHVSIRDVLILSIKESRLLKDPDQE
ncbi:unnamed protein product [Leptosia nina]|uniref:Peptidase S1 domain-containing protein n=1 Tax=Leptosia nina TaxID=320188 RepID=A0AAV1JQ84_9NEOP